MKRIIVHEDDIDAVELQTSQGCCGIEELSRIYRGINAVICKVSTCSERLAMIFFTDEIDGSTYGIELAKLIRRKKLGSLQTSKKVNNPNTGNTIQMWLWYPDWTSVDKYVQTIIIKDNYKGYDD